MQRSGARRQLLGGAVAAGATLAPPAIAAPDWLQDVPTESADETFAAARRAGGQAPSAVMTPSTQRTQSSRETSAAAAKAALDGASAATRRAPLHAHRAARRTFTCGRRARARPPKIGDVDVELWPGAGGRRYLLGFALGDPASAEAPAYASAILDERAADAPVVAARRLRWRRGRSIGPSSPVRVATAARSVAQRGAVAAKLREPSAGTSARASGEAAAPSGQGVTVWRETLDATPGVRPSRPRQ